MKHKPSLPEVALASLLFDHDLTPREQDLIVAVDFLSKSVVTLMEIKAGVFDGNPHQLAVVEVCRDSLSRLGLEHLLDLECLRELQKHRCEELQGGITRRHLGCQIR